MKTTIALIGNPNSGKTTMFNDLTGSAQYVGNWPGVTVEKKEGKLRGHKDIAVVDLPGIYSMSPYTLEEVISRKYIREEKPDVIIDLVDASNLDRNLYLTTQLLEMGIPVVVALNMMDIVRKQGRNIDIKKLSEELGCPVVATSAVKGEGLQELIKTAIDTAKKVKTQKPLVFSKDLEEAVEAVGSKISSKAGNDARWYAIKLIEGDDEVLKSGVFDEKLLSEVSEIVKQFEKKSGDDAVSMVAGERYALIGKIVNRSAEPIKNRLTTSDKIDSVVTNKWLALPIFFGILYLIYYLAITTIGDAAIGVVEGYAEALGEWATGLLEGIGAGEVAISLVVDGIIAGVGAVFTFVPQLMIMFFFLSLLEDSGYMARVAFIMDRLFRKFGLSGKSFIPMLVGTGCSIPGVMASRTIENERDRRMTIMLTPFIPCGAKLPVFGMFIAMIFNNAAWLGPTIYIVAIIAVILSGILLKRTKRFQGDPAPFVMELPSYKLPSLKGVLIHMWEKAKSFIKKAGSVILISSVVLWVLQRFNWSFELVEDLDQSILASIGGAIRYIFVPMGFGDSWAPAVAAVTGLVAKEVVVTTFATVGAVSPIMFTKVTALSFIVFTMFAAPCFAAIGAMRRELGSGRALGFALLFQTGVAYVCATAVNLLGNILLAGTDWVVPMTLEYEGLEDVAAETALLPGDIVLYVFAAIMVIAVITMIINYFKSAQRYKKVGTEA